jgi:RimJ/RimL family protein N-acetyltransferase
VTPRSNAFGQPIGSALEGWQPRPLPPAISRDGRYCRLEPLDPHRHAAALYASFAAVPDGRDWTYLGEERPSSPDAFAAFVGQRASSRDPLHFAVVVDGAAAGSLALMRIDGANGTIEIGHVAFGPKLQRTPAGTEAVALMMAAAFDDGGYRRLEWKCDSLNAPSRRAALRYGFTFEGIFRQAVVTKGRSRDTAWYSIVDGEWPAVKAALDRWLDPANFDPAGRQVQTLASLRAPFRAAGA